MTVRVSDISEQVSIRCSITRTNASAAVVVTLDVIRETLIAGGEVAIPGIGTFSVEETQERSGRNPRTGELIQIPAGRRVKVTISRSLKAALAERSS